MGAARYIFYLIQYSHSDFNGTNGGYITDNEPDILMLDCLIKEQEMQFNCEMKIIQMNLWGIRNVILVSVEA